MNQGYISNILSKINAVYFKTSKGVKLYKLDNGKTIAIKYATLNKRGNYMYGITPSTIKTYKSECVEYLVLVMNRKDYKMITINELDKYIENTTFKKKKNGTVDFFHVFIDDDQKLA